MEADDKIASMSEYSPITEPLPENRIKRPVTQTECKPMLSLGTRIGEFRVIEGPIGEITGEAEVYRCTRFSDETRDYALKLYRPQVNVSEAVLQNLFDLPHPNVLPIFFVGRWNNQVFDVAALCAGGPLLFPAPLKESTLRRLLEEVLAGLQHLHQNGIIHCDLKPGNLLFQYPDMTGVVIADFGNSRLAEALSDRPSRFTPDYAAPEIWQNGPVTEKTDYYALGMILLHWCWGFSPFRGKDREYMKIKHCRLNGEVLPVPFGLNRSLVRLIWGLTRKTPALRWGFRQVEQWLNAESVMLDDGTFDRLIPGEDRAVPAFPPLKTVRSLKDLSLALDCEEYHKIAGIVFQDQTLLIWLRNFDSDSLLSAVRTTINTCKGSESDFPDVRNAKRQLGIFCLRCIFDPSLRIEFPGRTVGDLAELDDLLVASSPAQRSSLGRFWQKGFMEKWVELSQLKKPAWEKKSAAFLDVLRKIAPYSQTETDEAGFFAVRCALARVLRNEIIPFIYLGIAAENPARLAEVIDRHPASWTEKACSLDFDAVRSWLWAIGFFSAESMLHEHFQQIVTNKQLPLEEKLEAILQILDPRIPLPKVTWKLSGQVPMTLLPDTTHTLVLDVANESRGWLGGMLTIRTETPENFRLGQGHTAIALKNGAKAEIQLNAGYLVPEDQRIAAIIINHYHDSEMIPIGFQVGIPFRSISMKALIAAVLGGVMMFLILPDTYMVIFSMLIFFMGYLGFSRIFSPSQETWRYLFLLLTLILLYLGIFSNPDPWKKLVIIARDRFKSSGYNSGRQP